jgi:hypothetical protein
MGGHVGLHSGLGPSTVTCHVDGKLIRTGRKEWPEMGAFRRAWYCLVSVFYAAVIGAWGLLMYAGSLEAMKTPLRADPGVRAPLQTQLLLLGIFSTFFLGGLGIQAARVRGSTSRSRAGTVLTHRNATIHMCGQPSTILLMLILGAGIIFLIKWLY